MIAFAIVIALQPLPARAQAVCSPGSPDSVSVPFVLSHDRILVHGKMLFGEETEPVSIWVDPGNPDLWVSGGLSTYVSDRGVALNDARIVLDSLCLSLEHAGLPRTMGDESVGPGLPADLNLSSTVLRDYDVVIDYPRRTLTVASPGKVAFKGVRLSAFVGPSNGLVVVTLVMDGQPVALGLDPGTPVTFIDQGVADDLFERNPKWPSRLGAVGRANLWGGAEEATWTLTEMPPLQGGGLEIPPHLAVVLSRAGIEWLGARAGRPIDGLLGADALLESEIGIDFRSGALYWERRPGGLMMARGALDVTLGLRQGEWTVVVSHGSSGDQRLGGLRAGDVVRSIDGASTTGRSMGEVWDMLLGAPGEERRLGVIRSGEPGLVVVRLERILTP